MARKSSIRAIFESFSLLMKSNMFTQIEKFLKKQNGDFLKSNDVIIAHDPNKSIAQESFQVFKFPETIIINKSGRMQDKIIGLVDWHSPEILERIRK